MLYHDMSGLLTWDQKGCVQSASQYMYRASLDMKGASCISLCAIKRRGGEGRKGALCAGHCPDGQLKPKTWIFAPGGAQSLSIIVTAGHNAISATAKIALPWQHF